MKIASHWLMWSCAVGVLALAPSSKADDQIRTYSIPKEHPDAAPATVPMPASDIPVADVKNSAVHWTAPQGWKTLAPTSIRIGNLLVEQEGKKAEITVLSFPGSVGTELDNVNRWRREVGMEAISQNEIDSKPVTVDGNEGKIYNLVGASARTLVAAVPHEGNTWFFKMRGDKDVVERQQAAFLDFLKSVTFNSGGGQTQQATASVDTAPANPHAGLADAPNPHAAPGAADPHAGQGAPVGDGSAEAPKWNVPDNWQDKAPGPMILKSFSVPGDNGSATVSISMFPGEVGGVLANVNRWRGQLGLGAVESDALPKVTQSVDVAGGKAVLVDFTGSDKAGQPAHLVAAIVPHGGSTWFYKLMGEGALVAREKEKFVRFVQTVQYP